MASQDQNNQSGSNTNTGASSDLNMNSRNKPPPRPGHLKCTHMKMIRKFCKDGELSCSLCRKLAQSWVWVCIDDRELVLEDEVEKGTQDDFDNLGDIFGKRPPQKKGPTARRYINGFFDELEDTWDDYTPKQIKKLFHQRSEVITKATQSNPSAGMPTTAGVGSPAEGRKLASDKIAKPWLPINGGECGAMFCQKCKPSSIERSFISIDGIVNGDLPLHAIHATGFELLGQRPVSDARIVGNLGLRTPRPWPGAQASADDDKSSIATVTTVDDSTSAHQCSRSATDKQSTTVNGITTAMSHATVEDYSTANGSALANDNTHTNGGTGVKSPTRSFSTAHLPEVELQHFDRIPNMEALKAVSAVRKPSLPDLTKDEAMPLVETPFSPTNGSFPPQVPIATAVLERRHSFADAEGYKEF